jgi:CHAT domain-containing protein
MLAIIADPVLGPELPPLAFAAEEASSIAAMLPAGEVTLRTREAAARGPNLFHDMARHRILHFATHAELNHLNPSRSSIVLTGSAVTLDDINNSRIDADLVVLSACRTALGQELKGEGLLGLTHGFLNAGANRVLAALWNVDDQASATFMREFYSHLLIRKAPPPQALMAAQNALKKNPRWVHPWYWAGFALHGYWR